MDKELLEALSKLLDNKLDEKLEPIKSDLKELSKKIDGIAEQTADLTEFKTTVISKLEELKEVEEVTRINCYDIAKLKSVK